MGFSGAATQNLNIQRHLESVRRGGGSPPARSQAPYPTDSKSGMSDSKSGMSDSKSGMSDSKSGLVEQQVDSEGKERLWSAYLEATGAWSEVGSGASAYNFDTRGATLGVDRRIGDNFVFGVLGSYNTLDADFANFSSIEGESYKGALYATYFSGGFFVDALLGAGYNSYDTSRSGFLGFAEGSTDGWELDAMLNTGYDIHNGNWTFTPFASLAYTRVTLNGFTETGSTSPLTFPTQSQDSLRSDLGVKVAYSVALDNGMVFTPQVRLAWQHEFLDSTQSIDSSFVSAPGSPFTVNGPAIDRDRALLSAGLNVQLTPTVNIYAYYDGQLGSSNVKSNSVTLGVMMEF
jgi:outer membrane autotransporter protein